MRAESEGWDVILSSLTVITIEFFGVCKPELQRCAKEYKEPNMSQKTSSRKSNTDNFRCGCEIAEDGAVLVALVGTEKSGNSGAERSAWSGLMSPETALEMSKRLADTARWALEHRPGTAEGRATLADTARWTAENEPETR